MSPIAGFSLGGQQLAIGLVTSVATLAGGGLVLRLGTERRLLVGFGCGAILGVALSDLLPEAFALGRLAWPPGMLIATVAFGLAAYGLIDRVTGQWGRHGQAWAAHLGPASLVAHSLMDGLAIGVAFAVSPPAGLVVAAGVVAHDLVDGANTVTLSFARRLGARSARRWLAADALAPLAGLALSHAVRPTPGSASLLLALFAGLFLYIGIAELLPRARSGELGPSGAAAAALGAAAVFCAVRRSGA